MKVECVIPSCRAKFEAATSEELKAAGWCRLTESSKPPAGHTRTHLGWCEQCAKKFDVTKD